MRRWGSLAAGVVSLAACSSVQWQARGRLWSHEPVDGGAYAEFMSAVSAERSFELERAKQGYERVLSSYDDARVRVRLGAVHCKMGHVGEALTLWREVEKDSPRESSLFAERALCLRAAGRPDEALADEQMSAELEAHSWPKR